MELARRSAPFRVGPGGGLHDVQGAGGEPAESLHHVQGAEGEHGGGLHHVQGVFREPKRDLLHF